MNKGFTLVELLAVLIVLSFLIALAVPSYTSVLGEIKRSNYRSKISHIEAAAYKYSESIKDEVKNNKCMDTDVEELIRRGYIVSESTTKDVIYNPVDNQPMDGILKMCYCKNKLDVQVNYSVPFLENGDYYPGDVVTYEGIQYLCRIKYFDNGGIHSTYVGKPYFEKIDC